MSIYGSLYSGVSGIKGQGTKIGAISDNISNVNTVGYKANKAYFETLVNNSASSVSYNPGGVLAGVRQLVSKQGLLTSTDSNTDIAIQGSGMFVVSQRPDSQASDARMMFTRAGQFEVDALGNMYSRQGGFYLQGWPLDREGRLPGQPGNVNTVPFSTTQSLETVNIEFGNGVVAATTQIDVGTNLDARQPVARGNGQIINFSSGLNSSISADDPIAPIAGTLVQDNVDNGSGVTDGLGTTLRVTTSGGLIYDFEYGGFSTSGAITGAGGVDFSGAGGVDITSTTQTFFTSGSAPASGVDSQFIIDVDGTPYTFEYKQSSPNPLADVPQFNNMQTLAQAISNTPGLNARIVNDQLVIVPDDANSAMTFTNAGATDFVGSLGMYDTVAAGSTPRFGTLRDLANKVGESDGITFVLENPLSDTALGIYTEDPLGTVTFTDVNMVANGGAAYDLVQEMGLWADADADSAFDVGENIFSELYDPANIDKNMSDGAVTPHFSRNVRIYDALGTGHNITISYLKVADNTWAAEVYASDDGDINGALVGNQIARGNIVFNGDGSLRSISSGLSNPINIIWNNGASPSEITMDWGNAGFPAGTTGVDEFGDTSGLSQFAADYNVAFINQNGAEVGSLINVTIDEEGYVIANYSNGENQKLYKLPLADFPNYNGLEALTGNVWAATQEAGDFNLREAKTNGVGNVRAGVVEASNVELSEELTDMIVAQRAYQSNTKVISTADTLLEELNRLVG